MTMNTHAQEMLRESENKEIHLRMIEFNVRGNDVVATFLYEDLFEAEDVHLAPRPKDPMFLHVDELGEITQVLDEKGIAYHVRNDEFI